MAVLALGALAVLYVVVRRVYELQRLYVTEDVQRVYGSREGLGFLVRHQSSIRKVSSVSLD